MDHIVSCILGAGSSTTLKCQRPEYIETSASPSETQPPSQPLPPQPPQTQERPFAWRMYPQPERKYQLFPKDKQLPPAVPAKGLEPEQALAPGQGSTSTGASNSDKALPSTNGLRLRIKEHNLIRRRKVSVPELGPMTTVQEVAMDSPTIPGRPPLHERSISAPGNGWRQQNHLVDYMIGQPAYSDIPEGIVSENFPLDDPPRCSSAQAVLSPTAAAAAAAAAMSSTPPPTTSRPPYSPKTLTPLVIPPHAPGHTLQKKASSSSLTAARPSTTPLSAHGRMRSGSTVGEGSLWSARSDESRALYTPLSAASATSTLPTPISAAIATTVSQPETNYALVTTPKRDSATDAASTPKTAIPSPSATPEPRSASAMAMPVTTATNLGHRRWQSESGSIMERGRPRKRKTTKEGSAVGAAASAATTPGSTAGTTLKRSGSKANRGAERRAFETLPSGCKATDAATTFPQAELGALAAQAQQQAARFEVLRKEDVDVLSRELRNLDERTEYLRRTYMSLRAGRRNLHARICQYLRAPRVAKFSHDAMLRQEEALGELDASIDDWVTKLEQAENRRTRVRQKLLEHVAAAVTLQVAQMSQTSQTSQTSMPSTATAPVVSVSETLQLAMGIKPASVSTPPRSPRKVTAATPTATTPTATTATATTATTTTNTTPIVTPVSSSPQRPTAHVPSTILEQPLVEEAMAKYSGQATPITDKPFVFSPDVSPMSTRRGVESIRVYAGNDVYALLADVEDQITQMGAPGQPPLPPQPQQQQPPPQLASIDSTLSDARRTQLHRQHSHELLNGTATTTVPPATPLPIPEEPAKDDGTIFLTNAVFSRNRSVLAI